MAGLGVLLKWAFRIIMSKKQTVFQWIDWSVNMEKLKSMWSGLKRSVQIGIIGFVIILLIVLVSNIG